MSENDFIQKEKNLQYCKDRALEILENNGTPLQAWTSFLSDMNKDKTLSKHPALQMGMMLSVGGHLSTPEAIRNHIEGYN